MRLRTWKVRYTTKQFRCHSKRLQAARLLRSLSRRISTVCRAYVRCSRQTRIACLVQKQLDAEDRSGRSNCTQRTGDDGGKHTALLFPSSRKALPAALLSNFDRAFGKVPDLHCFNRCTVAARTLARLLRRCYPTRDCCRCYVASRIPQDTRCP